MTDGWILIECPDGRTVGVRQWRVGDALACSSSLSPFNARCELPAVVLRMARENRTQFIRAVCPRHFLTFFWPGGLNPSTEAHRRARAELLEMHRDEYQDLYERRLAELMAECASAIPVGLHRQLGPQVAEHLENILKDREDA